MNENSNTDLTNFQALALRMRLLQRYYGDSVVESSNGGIGEHGNDDEGKLFTRKVFFRKMVNFVLVQNRSENL